MCFVCKRGGVLDVKCDAHDADGPCPKVRLLPPPHPAPDTVHRALLTLVDGGTLAWKSCESLFVTFR